MEWALVIISTVAVIFGIKKGVEQRRIFLSLLLPILTIHILLQGMRWQMGIVYLFIIMELIKVIIRIGKEKSSTRDKSQRNKKIMPVLWILGFIINFLLIFFMRYNEMDVLNGNYQVGTIAFDVVDEEREEFYGERAGDLRKVKIQIWYPTDNTEGLEKAKWLYDGKDASVGLPAYVGLPSFSLSYTARIDSNSYMDAKISQKQEIYPVVIISHGWYGFRNLHTDVAERLASEGYIAICVEHTYGSLATVFDDGTVHLADPATLPSADDEDAFAEAAYRLVETYAEDVKETMDVLEEINQGLIRDEVMDPNFLLMFEGRIDVDKIGLMGHSTGGGGVVKTAMTDERVDAVLGFDPWIEPIQEEYLSGGLSTPSIFISSEQWRERPNDQVLKALAQVEETKTVMYQLNDSYHQDFTMMYMFEPVAKLIGFTGDIDAERSREIQQEYAVQFFDYYLRDKENQLFELDVLYDEIIMKEWDVK